MSSIQPRLDRLFGPSAHQPEPPESQTLPKRDSRGLEDHLPVQITSHSKEYDGRASDSSISKQPSTDSHSNAHDRQPSLSSRPQSRTGADAEVTRIVREPETRPISQEQLVAEVKGIYAGLVMVESKCIEVDNAQNAQKDSPHKLNNEQWQALIALHRTLLHEHHDFFLASQHPSASLALQRLASKYSMPARMWRHGIHSFLELLRHRLPASLEHMLTFIYLAYSMMALLYETVPAFEDTWIECLGDLGRYRMAIEDDNLHDREIWTGVSRHWYSKASDKAPTTGRLYHHLAILARPNAIQQLFYYLKSLCVPIPFHSARDSIMTLFEPILGDNTKQLQPVDLGFIRTHAVLFSSREPERLLASMQAFLSHLDGQIGRTTRLWLETGAQVAVCNTAALFSYGSDDNPLWACLKSARSDGTTDVEMGGGVESDRRRPGPAFDNALKLFVETHRIVFKRYGDPNTFGYLHVILVALFRFVQTPEIYEHVAEKFPFGLLARALNRLASSCDSPSSEWKSSQFPGQDTKHTKRPLPEDFTLRGLAWTDNYFPDDWFSNVVDEDERGIEVASMAAERKLRCLYLATRIVDHGHDVEKHKLGLDSGSNLFLPLNEPKWDNESHEDDDESYLPDAGDRFSGTPATSTAETSRTSTWTSGPGREENDEEMTESIPVIIS